MLCTNLWALTCVPLIWGFDRYVGGAPGKIDLYVGKEVVRRGIPMDGATEGLVELIKEVRQPQARCARVTASRVPDIMCVVVPKCAAPCLQDWVLATVA